MSDGTLSQAEIDALMQGADNLDAGSGIPGTAPGGFSDAETDKLVEVLGEMSAKLGDPLTGMSGKGVQVTNPNVESTNNAGLEGLFGANFVEIAAKFTGDVSGENVIYLGLTDALVLSAISMGEDGASPPAELDQVHQSALSEIINQMFSSGLNAVKSKYNKTINLAQPKVTVINDPSSLNKISGDAAAKVTYHFSVEGILSTSLYQVMEKNLASGLARLAMSASPMSFDMGDTENVLDSFDSAPMASASGAPADSAQGLELPQFGESVPQEQQGNIGLLMDVPMTMTVELGRTKMMIKEILGLGEGSIIELEKLAGEPVDLLVNGKLIAKGEVVVIDENFGVRVTDIISPAERMKFAE